MVIEEPMSILFTEGLLRGNSGPDQACDSSPEGSLAPLTERAGCAGHNTIAIVPGFLSFPKASPSQDFPREMRGFGPGKSFDSRQGHGTRYPHEVSGMCLIPLSMSLLYYNIINILQICL